MEPRPKKLLDQVRDAIRLKRCSYRTEQSDVAGMPRYILFHDNQYPLFPLPSDRLVMRCQKLHLPDSAGSQSCRTKGLAGKKRPCPNRGEQPYRPYKFPYGRGDTVVRPHAAVFYLAAYP